MKLLSYLIWPCSFPRPRPLYKVLKYIPDHGIQCFDWFLFRNSILKHLSIRRDGRMFPTVLSEIQLLRRHRKQQWSNIRPWSSVKSLLRHLPSCMAHLMVSYKYLCKRKYAFDLLLISIFRSYIDLHQNDDKLQYLRCNPLNTENLWNKIDKGIEC